MYPSPPPNSLIPIAILRQLIEETEAPMIILIVILPPPTWIVDLLLILMAITPNMEGMDTLVEQITPTTAIILATIHNPTNTQINLNLEARATTQWVATLSPWWSTGTIRQFHANTTTGTQIYTQFTGMCKGRRVHFHPQLVVRRSPHSRHDENKPRNDASVWHASWFIDGRLYGLSSPTQLNHCFD